MATLAKLCSAGLPAEGAGCASAPPVVPGLSDPPVLGAPWGAATAGAFFGASIGYIFLKIKIYNSWISY